VQYLLRHKSIRTTALYAHIADIKKIKVKSPLDHLFKELLK